jgi:ribose transport system substrate-binding protein
VAIVMHTVTSDWANHLVQGIVGLLGECGAIVIEVVDCAFSSDVQIAALNRLREEAPDAIISLPVDNTTVADAHRAISRTGIKLVLIDNVPTGMLPGKDYVSLVSADNYGLGKIAAELLSSHLPQNSTAGLLGYDADFFAANEREIAFIHWMEINRPDVTIKTARFASIEHAGNDAERLIDDTSGISGLFVVWDTPCVDVIRKLSKRNLTLPISTVDLGQEVTINLAQGGNIIGISSQRPFQQGETAAKTIITSLLDRGCPDWVALPGLKVSSSNVIESYQFIWRKPAPMDILSGLNITKTK